MAVAMVFAKVFAKVIEDLGHSDKSPSAAADRLAYHWEL
jgi:hypothetical protein